MAPADGPLHGRVAIVTGGGRGLGRAIAMALARAGADVAVAGRGMEALDETAAELVRGGRRALAVQTDVTSEQDCELLVARTVERLGRVDALVANAGVLQAGALLESPAEAWRRVVDTNLTGTYLCARAVGPRFAAQRSGKLIVISSMWAYRGVAGFVSYCASKAGLTGFTRALAVEWAPLGVQVNAIAPGYFETDINVAARADDRTREAMLRQIPAGRMGHPDELGPLAVFLSSAASDFMTGETIVMDGGQTAR
jgi:2-deoxy-D-gluconate 3-dehydrogenase